MTETGVVVRTGPTATIRLQRTSACGKCRRCRPAGEIGEGYMLIDAVDPHGAEVGDTVLVTVAPGTALVAAAYAYMVPWAGAVLGLFLGTMLGPHIGIAPETLAIVLLGVGVAGGFLVARAYDRRSRSSNRFLPEIKAVLTGHVLGQN